MISPLLRINPFSFPKNIHVLEHLDRLVEIFNVCWPLYAAMPAVLKSAIEDLEAGSLSALGATAGQVPVADGLGSWAWGAQAGGTQTIQVQGTTPVITAVANKQYICGEVATLDITLPASGCIDVVFESGSTPTVLTSTPPTGVTVKWANGFDTTALEANTTYEINIKDGLGVGAAWT